MPFHAGDTILAFTDGLIERRGEDISHGQERVLHALSGLARPDLSRPSRRSCTSFGTLPATTTWPRWRHDVRADRRGRQPSRLGPSS